MFCGLRRHDYALFSGSLASKLSLSFSKDFISGEVLKCINPYKSKRKAMNRNWYNQKANPALDTKAGNK